MSDWNELRDHLMRGGAYGYWWVVTGKQKHTIWWETHQPAPVPEAGNVYFGVHPVGGIPALSASGEPVAPEHVKGRVAIVAAVNCLFAEYDAKDFGGDKEATKDHIAGLPDLPTAIVDSGGGLHCYWLLREPYHIESDYQRRRAQHLQAEWVRYAGGDTGAKDLARVLRVPGTYNRKPAYAPDFPQVQLLHYDDSCLYDLDDLAAHLPPMPKPTNGNQQHTASVEPNEARYWLDKYLSAPGPRNARCFHLCNQLRDNGFTRNEAEAVVLEFAGAVRNAGDHPFTDREALATLASSYGGAKRDPALRKAANYGSDDSGPPPLPDEYFEEPEPEAESELSRVEQIKAKIENSDGKEGAQAMALLLVPQCAALSKTELLWIDAALLARGVTKAWVKEWRQAVAQKAKALREERAQLLTQRPADAPETWPYEVENGRIVYLAQKPLPDGGVAMTRAPVADFTAAITSEVSTEEGDKVFVIEGQALRGGPFRAEIDARHFADEKILKSTIAAAVGARDPLRAGMGKHLGPSVQLFTAADLPQITRYSRTGWQGESFLIPGMEAENIEIRLPRKLPYRLDPAADLKAGMAALESLLQSVDPRLATIALATILQAPLAHLAGWRGERYCLFIKGRTGSFKTAFSVVLMCIYGSEHQDEGRLIKWGEGATRNAVMGYATHAHDLPLLIDNYKPTTGGGSRDFINLIHNILEGSEKDRLTRTSELRDSRPIYCWPICTGEDVPDSDPASLARALIIPFEWQKGDANEHLTAAQNAAFHLPAIGRAWIEWLQSEEGQAKAKAAGAAFAAKRDELAAWLRKLRADMVNIMRVASSMAGNMLTWQLALEHPEIGPLLKCHNDQYRAGMALVGELMAESTAEALEATRYLNALQELLDTGRGVLLPIGNGTMARPEQIIGWYDESGMVYILPDTARRAVDQLLGIHALGGLSAQTLNNQLFGLGVVASRGEGNNILKKKQVYKGHIARCLWLSPGTLSYTELPNIEGPPGEPPPYPGDW